MENASIGRIKGFALALLALGGGVLGGFLFALLNGTVLAQTEAPQPVRASAVELVDSAGNRVAVLGTDEKRNATLAFFDLRGKKRAEFGLIHGENPRLDINDPQGISVLSLDLGQRAKPRVMLSDPDFTARVYLGVVEPDSPSPGWNYDNWVLRFTGNNTRALAIIGMTTTGSGAVSTFDQKGHAWRTPLK